MKRRGFTLVELVAALGLGALVIALAAGTLGVLQHTGTHVSQFTVAEEANAQLATSVARAFSMVQLPSPESRTLHADQHSVKLRTQCRSPWGGLETCETELVLQREADVTVLLLRDGAESTREVHRITGRATWAWLEISDDGARWRTDWNIAGSLPLAARIATDADTLHYIVGAHR